MVVQDYLVALPDQFAAHLGVFDTLAPHQNEGRVVAQHLFAGVADLVRVVHQVLQLVGILHQQSHAVTGHRARRFIAGGDEQQEKPDKFVLVQALDAAVSVQQGADDIFLGIGLVFFRQLHGVGDDIKGGQLRCLLASCHLRVLVEHHGVGPLEEVLAVLRGDATQLQDGEQRQLGGYFFHKFTFTAAGDLVDDVACVLSETIFVGVHGPRCEGGAHNLAIFELPRRVHIDDHMAVNILHVLLRVLVCQSRARFTGKQHGVLGDKIDFIAARDQPVRHAHGRVFHIMYGARFANTGEFFIGHPVGVGIGVDHIAEIGEWALAHGGGSRIMHRYKPID